MKLKKSQDKPKIDLSTFRFSVSSIKSYRQCGLKFYREKVLKLKSEEEKTHHRWLGRVVHNSIYQEAANYEVTDDIKFWNLVGLTEDKVGSGVSLFNDLWDYDSEKSDEYIKNIALKETGPKPGTFVKKSKFKALNIDDPVELEKVWKVQATKMVENGVTSLHNIHKITYIEKALNFKFLNYPFLGYIDILAEDAEGKVEFYDFKTTWDKPTEEKVSSDTQFILYSYALKELMGLDYYPAGYLVHLRSGKLVKATIDDDRVRDEKDKFDKDLLWLEENIYTANLYDNLCPYCDFHSMCY